MFIKLSKNLCEIICNNISKFDVNLKSDSENV